MKMEKEQTDKVLAWGLFIAISLLLLVTGWFYWWAVSAILAAHPLPAALVFAVIVILLFL